MNNSVFDLNFPNVYGDIDLSATFREHPGDFYVEEYLGFELTGEGEHLCLYIEKQSHNTHWVASELSRFSGISERDIGICGRKDRHAITRQWFSLYDPERKDLDWSQFDIDGIKILEIRRHNKKLRLGAHKRNHFVIRLRRVMNTSEQFLSTTEKQDVLASMLSLLKTGVPNYFGPQRFGIQGNNLVMANEWFTKGKPPPKRQRSIVLSAARSYLFNLVLRYRVNHQTWDKVLDGEVLQNDQPTGPLWGRGRLTSDADVFTLEQTALMQFTQWCERMEHQGLKQERRVLLLQPEGVSCLWQDDDLIISFNLPVGTFATAVLAEMVKLKSAA